MTSLSANVLTEDVEGLSRLRAVLATDPGYLARARTAANGQRSVPFTPLKPVSARMDIAPCRPPLDRTVNFRRVAALAVGLTRRLTATRQPKPASALLGPAALTRP